LIIPLFASGGITFPLIIENNVFTSGNGNSANAIFLTNINGGAVKDNNITGYKNGVFLLSSSMDFYNNVIDGSYDNSTGFQGYSGSNISMGTSGNYYTAGQNVISAEGSNSKCVYVEKSFFDLHKGENIFDLKNYSSGQEYHLSGWFPNYQPHSTVSAVQNCFRESGTNTEARHNVKWVNGEDMRIQFIEYTCEVNIPEEKMLVDLGNNIIYTIFKRSGGSGGGKNNLEFGIWNLTITDTL
jgi:hypothetical protein